METHEELCFLLDRPHLAEPLRATGVCVAAGQDHSRFWNEHVKEDLYENLWDDVLCTDQEERAARGTKYSLDTLCDALELTGGERAHFVRTVRALFPGTYSGIWESLCAGY